MTPAGDLVWFSCPEDMPQSDKDWRDRRLACPKQTGKVRLSQNS